MKKLRKNKGITLIALVITIIVLLILAGVTIATLTGENGILNQANKAKTETTKASAKEQVEVEVLGSYGADGNLDNGLLKTNLNNIKDIEGVPDTIEDSSFPLTVTVDGVKIKIDKDGTVSYAFDAEEWDKTASDEDCFIWGSDTIGEEGYDVVVGYTSKIEGYTKLVFPSRCKKIEIWNNSYENASKQESRSFGYTIKKIELPDTITEIGSYSFCSSDWTKGFDELENVIIPNSVSKIGYGAFWFCKNLTEVVIGNNVESIGGNAFNGCTNLVNITIPDSVNSIGEGAFSDTAWYNNQAVGVVYAGKVAYKYKGEMPSNYNLELAQGTLGIADSAFSNYSNLSSAMIPNSVKNIGFRAFDGCTSLNSITIPDGVTNIKGQAFSGCTSLNNIIIPQSVSNMESQVFYNWTSSQTINIQGYSSAPSGWSNDWNSGCSATINWNQ